jgi:hypothetical protein
VVRVEAGGIERGEIVDRRIERPHLGAVDGSEHVFDFI